MKMTFCMSIYSKTLEKWWKTQFFTKYWKNRKFLSHFWHKWICCVKKALKLKESEIGIHNLLFVICLNLANLEVLTWPSTSWSLCCHSTWLSLNLNVLVLWACWKTFSSSSCKFFYHHIFCLWFCYWNFGTFASKFTQPFLSELFVEIHATFQQ